MNSDLAKQLSQNVRDFYEAQGEWFATTREKIIPEHAFVKEYVQPGLTVVDIGAGNGRFTKILPKEVSYIGVEPSESLRKASTSPNPSFARRGTGIEISYPPPYEGGVRGGGPLIPGSLPHLDLPDKTADITVCLAVLHHIPSKQTRIDSVKELIRLTKPGGIILATSWFRNPHHDRTTPVENGEPGDTWIPWTSPDGKTSQRFVHFMQPNEWADLWTHPELEIIKIGLHGKQTWVNDESEALNWRVIAKRR